MLSQPYQVHASREHSCKTERSCTDKRHALEMGCRCAVQVRRPSLRLGAHSMWHNHTALRSIPTICAVLLPCEGVVHPQKACIHEVGGWIAIACVALAESRLEYTRLQHWKILLCASFHSVTLPVLHRPWQRPTFMRPACISLWDWVAAACASLEDLQS